MSETTSEALWILESVLQIMICFKNSERLDENSLARTVARTVRNGSALRDIWTIEKVLDSFPRFKQSMLQISPATAQTISSLEKYVTDRIQEYSKNMVNLAVVAYLPNSHFLVVCSHRQSDFVVLDGQHRTWHRGAALKFVSDRLKSIVGPAFNGQEFLASIYLPKDEMDDPMELPDLDIYKLLYDRLRIKYEALKIRLPSESNNSQQTAERNPAPQRPPFLSSAVPLLQRSKTSSDDFSCLICKKNKNLSEYWVSKCELHGCCKSCAANRVRQNHRLVCPMFPQCRQSIDLSDVQDILSMTDIAAMEFSPMAVQAPVRPQAFDCPICAENVPISDVFLVCSSDHISCRNCARQFFVTNVIEQNQEMSCFADQACKASITPNDAEMCLMPEEIQKLREHFLRKGTRDCVRCTQPNCRGVAEVVPPRTDFECPICHAKICVECRQNYHPNMTCSEYRDSRSETGLLKLFNKLATDKAWQRCPNCKEMVERTQGCDHMQCTCGAHFCYICGTELKSKGPETHQCKQR